MFTYFITQAKLIISEQIQTIWCVCIFLAFVTEQFAAGIYLMIKVKPKCLSNHCTDIHVRCPFHFICILPFYRYFYYHHYYWSSCDITIASATDNITIIHYIIILLLLFIYLHILIFPLPLYFFLLFLRFS